MLRITDVAPGLWLWTTSDPRAGAFAPLTSTCIESNEERYVLDPVLPPEGAVHVFERLDAAPPTAFAVLKPDHVRDTDAFTQRYPAAAFGPRLFFRGDAPRTELRYVDPGTELPGDVHALYDGRGRNETPLWFPAQRTIVFADALNALDGELRVWATPWHEERTLPALRALLDLPFDSVVVSHGQPLHGRADYEAALRRPAFSA
ncbi:MAG: hypothetical protein JO322_14380 [Candidatus Eremiobacteraeota bacterium]|nr:hypothetical protein [Candidatus Eremiobacteraeota bacterium]